MSDRPARLSRRAKLVAASGSITLIVLGAVLSPVVQDLYERVTSGPDVGEQLDDLLREQDEQSRHPVFRDRATFHGSGPKSQVFVFRRSGEPQTSEHSDEIQIYDREESDLERAFRFRPRMKGGGTPERGAVPLEVSVEQIHDYADDGHSEIVGTMAAASGLASDFPMLPFAISWDAAAQDYRLYALFREALEWREAAGPEARRLHEQLKSPVRVVNSEGDSSEAIRGFPVGDFEVVDSEPFGAPVFLTSALVTTSGGIVDLAEEIELKAWRPDADPLLRPDQCYPFELQPGMRPYVVSADKTLVEAWEERPRNLIEC
jgi:hypothetical protein